MITPSATISKPEDAYRLLYEPDPHELINKIVATVNIHGRHIAMGDLAPDALVLFHPEEMDGETFRQRLVEAAVFAKQYKSPGVFDATSVDAAIDSLCRDLQFHPITREVVLRAAARMGSDMAPLRDALAYAHGIISEQKADLAAKASAQADKPKPGVGLNFATPDGFRPVRHSAVKDPASSGARHAFVGDAVNPVIVKEGSYGPISAALDAARNAVSRLAGVAGAAVGGMAGGAAGGVRAAYRMMTELREEKADVSDDAKARRIDPVLPASAASSDSGMFASDSSMLTTAESWRRAYDSIVAELDSTMEQGNALIAQLRADEEGRRVLDAFDNAVRSRGIDQEAAECGLASAADDAAWAKAVERYRFDDDDRAMFLHHRAALQKTYEAIPGFVDRMDLYQQCIKEIPGKIGTLAQSLEANAALAGDLAKDSRVSVERLNELDGKIRKVNIAHAPPLLDPHAFEAKGQYNHLADNITKTIRRIIESIMRVFGVKNTVQVAATSAPENDAAESVVEQPGLRIDPDDRLGLRSLRR